MLLPSPFPWHGHRAGRFARTTALLIASGTAAAAGPATVPHLGRPVSPEQAQAASWNVFPDGRGLPPGSGSAVDGAALYQRLCASCHGPGGRGASAEELAGGTEPLTSAYPDKTIGLYWPYATTLFDFIRRSKPMDAPGSLTNDQVYALTAYLLQINGVAGVGDVLDANRLARVRMPNRNGFIGVDAPVRSSR